MRTINEIIIHCADTPEGRKTTVADLEKWHKERGFKTIGYHYVILLDGKVEAGRPIEQMGAHCEGHNANSIGVCYVGGAIWRDGVDSKGKPIKGKDGKAVLIPKDTRTDAQKQALKTLVQKLMKQYKLTAQQVHGHNEFANKACPSFDVQAWKKEVKL